MPRTTSAILVLVLVAACGGSPADVAAPRRTPNGDAGLATPAPTAVPGSEPTSAPGAPNATAPPARQGAGDGAGGAGGGGPSGPQPAGNDNGSVGDNAFTYLRGDVPRLVIEVDAVSGKQPASGTIDHLRAKLGEVLTKPSGIELQTHETFGATDSRYTDEEIRALAGRHRQSHTTTEAASLYVLFLNGSYEKDDSVLGVAFSASAYAIFSDTVDGASTPLVPPDDIERSVTLHEAGHLLRLVNIGYRSPRDHEDPDHEHHSKNRESVMYWAVESNLVSTALNGPPPDTFDAADKADLADLKAGRLG